MYGHPSTDTDETIVVNSANIQLDAKWIERPAVLRRSFLRIVGHLRHQAVTLGYVAIVAVLFRAGVRAQDTVVLSIALVLLAAMAVITEVIGAKYYGCNQANGAVASCDAPEDPQAA